MGCVGTKGVSHKQTGRQSGRGCHNASRFFYENLPCLEHVALQLNSNQIKSNQFYLYSPKSQSHCLSGLYNLYSEQHPLSLDPRFE